MKRLVNIRPSLYCVLSLVCGIISAVELIYGDIVFGIICALLMVVGIVFSAIFKDRLWLVVLIMFLAFSFGFAYTTIYRFSLSENEIVEKQTTITGRVTDIGRNGQQTNVLYLENCICNDGTKLKGRVSVPVYDGSSFSTGDVVTASGTLRSMYFFKNDVNVYGLRNRVYYRLSISGISFEEGKLTFAENVRKYIYQTSTNYGSGDGVVYALLTGDRNAISEETINAFNGAGIIHLLAVSGLHVGILVAAITLLLKLFKLKPIVELAILVLPLSFYAYLCGFSPSIVRAVLMLVCLYVSKILFGKYDLLTSLCWACLIILIASPLTLYDVGFQLSALSVFGIATIYQPLNRKLVVRLPRFLRWLCNSVCVSFSCTFATLFCMWHTFGKVSFAGVFANIFAVPIMSVALVISLLGMLPWIFHYVLFVADKLIAVVGVFAERIAGAQLVISADAFAISIGVAIALLFILGGYINFGKIAKPVSIGICCLALLCTTIFATLPQSCKNQVKIFNGYDDNCIVATTNNNYIYIVGDFCDSYQTSYVQQYVAKLKAKKIVIVIPHYSNCQRDNIAAICDTFDVSKIYKLNDEGNNEVDAYLTTKNIAVSHASKNRVVKGEVSIQPVFDGELRAVVVSVGTISVATVYGDQNSIRNFVDMRSDIDAYVMETVPTVIADRQITTFSLYQQKIYGNFGANKYGNFTLTEKDGKIILSFR